MHILFSACEVYVSDYNCIVRWESVRSVAVFQGLYQTHISIQARYTYYMHANMHVMYIYIVYVRICMLRILCTRKVTIAVCIII